MRIFMPATKMKKLHRQLVLLCSVLVVTLTTWNPSAWALSDNDLKAINGGYARYDPFATPCGTTADPSMTTPTGTFLPTGPGTELEGHKLPAATGGTGNEEEAGIVNGRIVLIEGNDAGNPLALNPKGVTDNDVKYYINMRWRYAVWNWRGDGNTGPEDVSWYTQKVRKVLVTNPKTGRGIITSIVESGPAPWTGTNMTAGEAPSYWQGYIDGTPPQYKGRVSGLSPSAIKTLANTTDLEEAKRLLQRRPDNIDNDLTYQWAPDQNMPAGTVVQGNQVVGTNGGITCTGGVANGQFVFYSQYDPRWKDECYGGGTKGNCTYSTVGEGGCGPSSVAMVVATLKDRSVTPKTVADYSTSQGWYWVVNGVGKGSKWDLLRYGPAKWGLDSKEIGTNLDEAISALRNGALVIASGTGASPYTEGGHILVIRGVTEGGKLLLGDSNVKIPADKARNNTMEWEPSTIRQGLRNLWIITPKN